MFNLFKKSNTVTINNTDENSTTTVKINSRSVEETNKLIDEIHETFYTEVDRLLADAKIRKSPETQMEAEIEKAKRLEKLGFKNAKEVQRTVPEIDRINGIIDENIRKYQLQEAIQYFSHHYPNYKFITEDSVKKICEKYGLIYGSVEKYIGTVPNKNLEHIENFSIKKEDRLYNVYIDNIRIGEPLFYGYCNSKEAERIKDFSPYSLTSRRAVLAPLEIAAPLKDFDTTDMEIKDYSLNEIPIPDPVVLQPVFFRGDKYYLIVTAWGQEASDELVVNQKMN